MLPRLEALDAPLMAVIWGATGAGKSTLVSSLVGEQMSRFDALRLTTRAFVLVHHPDDGRWFAYERVLPTLARLTGDAKGADAPSSLCLVVSAWVPRGLALLDAPDIDSVVAANRDLSRQLLAAADLWLLVTRAMRYAVPWELLGEAGRRSRSPSFSTGYPRPPSRRGATT